MIIDVKSIRLLERDEILLQIQFLLYLWDFQRNQTINVNLFQYVI